MVGAISSAQRLLMQHSRVIGLVLKVLITIAVSWYIYYRIMSAQLELSILEVIKEINISLIQLGALLFGSLLLMLGNWGCEVLKWKKLMDTFILIRWKTAIKGVVSGVSFGIFSPNRLGEFVGRVLALHPKARVQGTLLSFVNGIAQTLATFTYGVLGLIFLLAVFGADALGTPATLILQIISILCLGLMLIAYYRMRYLSVIFYKISWLKRWRNHFSVFKGIPQSVLRNVYHLSLLRFLTFLGQYLLLFQLVFSSPEWTSLIGASVLTLFSTTLLPFLPIPDVLLRESMALSFFDLFSIDLIKVSLVVFTVWIINVALPALAGSILLFTYRFFRK